jgi:hypothetical protein
MWKSIYKKRNLKRIIVYNKSLINFRVVRYEISSKALANDQLDLQILIHLLQSSTRTCFEQYLAHLQEIKLY